MARRTIQIFVSDISGQEVPENKARTIEFSYDGQSYTLDLTVEEGKGFDKAIKQYVDAAQPVAAPRAATRRSKGASAGPVKRDPLELRAIRDWARANGWPNLGDKGRIPYEAENAYNAAN